MLGNMKGTNFSRLSLFDSNIYLFFAKIKIQKDRKLFLAIYL